MEGPSVNEYFKKEYREFYPRGKRVICVQGMPGIALSGKFAVDYIVDNIGAEKLTDIFFYDFPPQVTIKQGLMLLPSISMYYFFNEKNEVDLIFLTGDFQPLTYYGVNLLSNILVKELQNYGVALLLSLGASAVNVPVKEPDVFVSSTSKELLDELLKKLNVKTFTDGIITGMNGFLPGIITELTDVKSAVFLAQACRYLPYDYYSSKKLISTISKYLSLTIDFTEINKKVAEMDETIKKLIQSKLSFEKDQSRERTDYIG
ncbi:MAG: PAC2 family protein [Candidatus Odinarchaeia archaeon]